mmetsp:Transcript_15017/g.35352  ORF Transcript_15017/g.35352 Transcript_15017/m.35352 type:complete len:679 (+) Transcript_15017:71-2107(+)
MTMIKQALLMACAVLVRAVTCSKVLHPAEIRFSDLSDPQQNQPADFQSKLTALQSALGSEGVVAITGIPRFSELRSQVLLGAQACISKSSKAQHLSFPDGTARHTLAASSSQSAGQVPVDHGSMSQECAEWDKTASEFRSLISICADKFAQQLDSVLGLSTRSSRSSNGPAAALLKTSHDKSYSTMSTIVAAGDRLEHFHSYDLPVQSEQQPGDQTIDFHVDQGLFIAFIPALLYNSDSGATAAPWTEASSSGTFALRKADGSEVEVAFEPDSLVILAGDGLNQLASLNKAASSVSVHAPLHAFKAPARGAAGWHRLWYGMMQLLPADAVDEATGLTYGDLRQKIIEVSTNADPDTAAASKSALGLGCSQQRQARELQASCTESQIYCWHRCFDYTETVSPEACAAQSLGFNCTSQWDQVWVTGHGDYNPACTNSTSVVTPLPTVPQPPIDGSTSTCSGFMDLVDDSSYANRVALVANETYLLWNVAGEEVHVKMVHNGRAGWMAVGINVGGARNGMYSAPVVMGQYNPESDDPLTVKEYKIHDSLSAYRHWKTPYSPSALSETMMSVTDCFTTMSFKTSSIYGHALNITEGSNSLIWGLTHSAYVTDEANGYAAYHSAVDGAFTERYRFRGHVVLAFTSEAATTTLEEDTSSAFAARLSLTLVTTLASALFVAFLGF